MSSKIFSGAMFGYECRVVEVEIDILNGPASITIVGLGDTAVQESKERIRSAIKNSGAEYPRRKKTINLAPADIPKHGPLFDLPLALGLLLASEQIPKHSLDKTMVIGELALSGELRATPGVLPVVAHAAKQGFSTVIIPEANAQEVALVSGITIIPVRDLASALRHVRGEEKIPPYEGTVEEGYDEPKAPWRFEDIRGHDYVKRALTIAAAGRHNVLLYGPPGSGKTILARSIQSILPSLSFEESLEVSKIYSIAGKLTAQQPLVRLPPFRAVHHTASAISLIGGGAVPKPGEISLAHHGILFLDELLEFSRSTLNCLRQPMEDGIAQITRAKGGAIFPAQFTLIAATNPCPCGYLGDDVKACRCTPPQLAQYRKKLSGPLVDRIDIECYVPRLPFEKITMQIESDTSENILKKVIRARLLQKGRAGGAPNGNLSAAEIREKCTLTQEAKTLLKDAFRSLHFSGRSYYRVVKVAATIADLEGASEIAPHHLAEALQYRPRMSEKLVT